MRDGIEAAQKVFQGSCTQGCWVRRQMGMRANTGIQHVAVIEEPKKSCFHGVVKGTSPGTGGEQMRKGEMRLKTAPARCFL